MRASVRIRRGGRTAGRFATEGDRETVEKAVGEFMASMDRDALRGAPVIIDMSLEFGPDETVPE